jgi:NAD-dependent dihydropyrimidine dehydrogenase PreA subunit
MTEGPWFPTIDSDQCDGCKGAYKCVKFCPHGVFEVREDKAVLVNPLGCIYGCSACADLCPKDAIIFPQRQDAHRLKRRKQSLLHRVVCRGCGKQFSTDRETEYCFDCEKKLKAKM